MVGPINNLRGNRRQTRSHSYVTSVSVHVIGMFYVLCRLLQINVIPRS